MRRETLKVGDIVYCIGEYKELDYDYILGVEGEVFKVRRIDESDQSYQLQHIDDPHRTMWLYYTKKYMSNVKELGYFWEYFVTKKSKAKRIRNIAKMFINN